MTKRERLIAICVGAAAGIYALDSIIITPQLKARAAIVEQYQKDNSDFEVEKGRIKNRAAYERKWEEYKAKGLLSDPNYAVQQVAGHLETWAIEQQLTRGVLTFQSTPQPVNRPGGKPGEKEPGFSRVGCKYSVTGGMAQIANFLGRIQQAEIPIRISEMQITTKAEGLDNQELSLTVSTLILQAGTSPGGTRSPTSQSSPTSGPSSRRQGGGT